MPKGSGQPGDEDNHTYRGRSMTDVMYWLLRVHG